MRHSLILAFQFLTHLPIPLKVDADQRTFRNSIYFFSLVGLLLGALLLAVNALLTALNIDPWSRAIALTIVHIIVTGGLHLDGVADTADALFSNRSAERMLEILKDSRIGSNGVLAIIITLSLKAVGLHFALAKNYALLVLLMPTIARFASILAFRIGCAAREGGMGNFFIGKARAGHLLTNALPLIIGAAIARISALQFLFFLLAVVVYTFVVVYWSTRKIGGITGDLLGFIVEGSEVVFVVAAMLMIR